MKSSLNQQVQLNDNFYKICVVGGGLTGALMMSLLKQSNMFHDDEIAWIKPINIESNDFRTTFYNSKSLKLLKKLNILNKIKTKDITEVKEIHAFGKKNASPLVWKSTNNDLIGAIIKNDKILALLNNQLKNIIQYDSLVSNTSYNEFERTIYLQNKTSIKSNLVLSADGKNSYLRKLSSINVIPKKTNHIAISGFLKQSNNHNFIAKQAFSKLGPIGILPYGQNDIINFVLSVEKNKAQQILSSDNPEQLICNELNDFFKHLQLIFKPLDQIENTINKLSEWSLDLNLVINPTANRIILVGDAAHSIHPLAGQGLNLTIEDCLTVINAIKNSLKFGNDLGDINILENYKKERLPHTLAMTAATDFLFYGFTSDSNYLKSILSEGMEKIEKSHFKNIFKYFAGSS